MSVKISLKFKLCNLDVLLLSKVTNLAISGGGGGCRFLSQCPTYPEALIGSYSLSKAMRGSLKGAEGKD